MSDILTFAIPFLFMLAVVFGALEIAAVFPNKKVNMLIAAVFALFGISYSPATEFINQILPFAMIFFIIFFFLGFVIKVAKTGLEDKQGKKDWTLLMILVGLVLLFLAAQGPAFFENFMPGFEEQGSNILIIAGIVFIVVLLMAAYKKGSGKGPG